MKQAPRFPILMILASVFLLAVVFTPGIGWGRKKLFPRSQSVPRDIDAQDNKSCREGPAWVQPSTLFFN